MLHHEARDVHVLRACIVFIQVAFSVCGEPAKPNVLMIILDDLRYLPDGYRPFVHTPNLLRLTQQGVTFTNAFSNGVHCAPSRASFLTGILPSRSGFMDKKHKLNSSSSFPS